jgi:hypothetical protein
MKFKNYFAAILLLATTLLFGCSKDSTPTTPTTNLQITVSDAGGTIGGASVTLYPSLISLEYQTNPVASLPTNSSGVVTFTNLTPQQYYWLAQDGCEAGTGNIVTTEDVTTKTTTDLIATGTLVFTNTSSNPYEVKVNGAVAYPSLAGGVTETLVIQPAEAYSIEVIQLSGYTLYPTDKTYTGTLSCGGTLTTTFP